MPESATLPPGDRHTPNTGNGYTPAVPANITAKCDVFAAINAPGARSDVAAALLRHATASRPGHAIARSRLSLTETLRRASSAR